MSTPASELPQYLTTKEVADLLRVKERRVYELAGEGDVPHIRATGKLLFPREDLLQWLHRGQSDLPVERPLVVAGSQDPLLEWAIRESGCGLALQFDGSQSGIDLFVEGKCVAASIHLLDKGETSYNQQAFQANCQSAACVLMQFTKRTQGIVSNQQLVTESNVSNHLAPNPSVKNLLQHSKLALRQPGAGSRVLFDQLAQAQGLSTEELLCASVYRTENDAVTAVATGQADVCVGPESLAKLYRLSFHPLVNEEVDIIVDRKAWFDEPWQKFLDFCRTEAFLAKAAEMAGYDVSYFGHIKLNSAR